MLTNNIEIDIKVKLLEAGLTQEQLGTKVGTTGQYINRVLKKKDTILNRTFVQMLEVLGYDVQIVYVPKKGRTK